MGSLISIFFVQLFALALPGPDFALVMRNALLHQRRLAVVSALGLAAGMLTMASLSAFILPMMMGSLGILLRAIHVLGGVYLLWMSWKALRLSSQPAAVKVPSATTEVTSSSQASHLSAREAFISGYICNITNPKALIFFVSLFSFLVVQHAMFSLRLTAVFEVASLGFAWFCFVAYMLSGDMIKQRLAQYDAAQCYIYRASSLIFLLFAVGLLFLV